MIYRAELFLLSFLLPDVDSHFKSSERNCAAQICLYCLCKNNNQNEYFVTVQLIFLLQQTKESWAEPWHLVLQDYNRCDYFIT